MKLIKPVTDSYGNPMIDAGLQLTEKHLRLMKTWGVEKVEILSDEEPPEQAVPEKNSEDWEALHSELLPFFIKANLEHPVMKEIFRLSALSRITGREEKRT